MGVFPTFLFLYLLLLRSGPGQARGVGWKPEPGWPFSFFDVNNSMY